MSLQVWAESRRSGTYHAGLLWSALCESPGGGTFSGPPVATPQKECASCSYAPLGLSERFFHCSQVVKNQCWEVLDQFILGQTDCTCDQPHLRTACEYKVGMLLVLHEGKPGFVLSDLHWGLLGRLPEHSTASGHALQLLGQPLQSLHNNLFLGLAQLAERFQALLIF